MAFFGVLELLVEPYDTKAANLINSTWNFILVVVLLSQGFVFENGPKGEIFTLLGIFIIFIVCATLAIVFAWLVKSWKENLSFKNMHITSHVFKKLSQDVQLRLLYVHAVQTLNDNGSLVLYESHKNTVVSRSDILRYRKTISKKDRKVIENDEMTSESTFTDMEEYLNSIKTMIPSTSKTAESTIL